VSHGGDIGGDLGQLPFSGAALGDARRSRRLVRLAASLVQGGADVGGTLTSVIHDPYQAKAAYRLLGCPEVTHQAAIAPHCQQVLAATQAAGDYLILEDSMALSFPDRQESCGLGTLGEHSTRGLWVHTALLVKPDWRQGHDALLGMLGQKIWARGQPGWPIESSEQQRWTSIIEGVGGPMGGTRWVYVADRESDDQAIFQSCWANWTSFVIRGHYDRKLSGSHGGAGLLSVATQAPVQGRLTVEVGGRKTAAEVTIRSTSVTLQGARRFGGRLEDWDVNVVYVKEEHPPRRVKKPLEWILLTDLPVARFKDCERVVAIYARRFLIEEWHKAIKTGLRVESSQLSTAQRLATLAGILSVIAVLLVQRKLEARRQPDQEVDDESLDRGMLAVLKKKHPPVSGVMTQRWLMRSMAKLGGFQGRKGDGEPGWLTIWRGWQALVLLAEGYELAMTIMSRQRRSDSS
jgi:hypothetical protein